LKVEVAVKFERSHGHHTIKRRILTLRREKCNDGVADLRRGTQRFPSGREVR
jgi:hypothetical protein